MKLLASLAWHTTLAACCLLLPCCSPEETALRSQRPAAANTVRGHQTREEVADPAFPLAALSLRVLQQQLASCVPRGECSEETLLFGGLTRLLGYALDPANRDIVVFGLADPERPKIQTGDFAVGLRNCWRLYAERRGDTLINTYPGCDIRPRPETVRALQELQQAFHAGATDAATERVIADWRRTCEEPQRVSVLGVPFDSHFGQVVVTADYEMKQLADGTEKLDVPGFAGVMELHLGLAKRASLAGMPMPASSSMNRFWLSTGEQAYEEADGVVWIHGPPVQVMTHPTGADRSGELSDVGGHDPMAEEFASRFSALYEQVGAQKPIYRELEGLFQLFALAQALHVRQAPEAAGLSLDYLLHSFPVAKHRVPREVPGRHAVQRFRHERAVPGGTELLQLWLPSCGGVEMRIDAGADSFRAHRSGVLPAVGRRVVQARPGGQAAVSWPVSLASSPTLRGLPHNARLRRLNRTGSPRVLTVEDAGSEYVVYADGVGEIYRGLDSSAMMLSVDRMLGERAPVSDAVYFELEGFSTARADALRSSCGRQLVRLRPGVELRTLRDVAGTTIEEVFFTPGIRAAGHARPAELVTEGPRAGLYRATWDFLKTVGAATHRFTLVVFARTAEAANAFLRALRAEFALFETSPASPVEIIQRVKRVIQREHNLSPEDLEILIMEEGGRMHSADLCPSRDAVAA